MLARMVDIKGLSGLRPDPARAGDVTSPPYDVIREGSPLEATLKGRSDSIFHVILGDDPASALQRLQDDGALVRDDVPCFYVYEQTWDGGSRTGLLLAAAVTPYEERQVIRHEKTFASKVKGRIALRDATAHTFGPVFVLSRAPLSDVMSAAKDGDPLYEFTTTLPGAGEMDGIANRVWRVEEDSDHGKAIREALAPHPLYIADGHHRYHAALLNEQTHFLCYVTDEGRILAYNRVVKGERTLDDVKDKLALKSVPAFATPGKHAFCLYTREGCWELGAGEVPDDVVGRLDCSLLERELYDQLGLDKSRIVDPACFSYFPESALDDMKALVDDGTYDVAIALHPVALDELMAVADAGLDDPEVVMPEKSTYFSPKILTGLFVYRHDKRAS
jgi:uncharacterized protein (DUF1015 family)